MYNGLWTAAERNERLHFNANACSSIITGVALISRVEIRSTFNGTFEVCFEQKTSTDILGHKSALVRYKSSTFPVYSGSIFLFFV